MFRQLKSTVKRLQLKYRGKLILYFVIAFAIYITVSVIVLVSNEKKSQASAKVDVLRTYTFFMEQQLAQNARYADMMTGLPDNYRMTLLSSKGEVLFDNMANPEENHLDREEIAKSMRYGEGFAIRKSETTNSNCLYYARKTDGGTYIRLAIPHEIRLDNLLQANNLLLYLSIFVFLVTLIILIYSTDKYWSVMRTLKKFTASAENGEIDYNSVRFPDTDSGEIGNKLVSLYKELETSKQEIIREKDLNRQLKQEMTNNIAHELKTPVSSIRGYLEILLGDKPVSDERRRYFLERSYFQTLRLSNLINDVSIINKIEESSELFTKEMLNVRNVSEEAADELSDLIAEKNITLRNNIPGDVEILGNHSLLYSIFRNLIENAVSYAGEDIAIGMEMKKEDRTFYYFRFYDTGCGVEEQYITRLFDRFLRIDKGRSRKNGGTGLGLSIVKHAVLFHEGSIVAKNAEAGGLEFYFSLKKPDTTDAI